MLDCGVNALDVNTRDGHQNLALKSTSLLGEGMETERSSLRMCPSLTCGFFFDFKHQNTRWFSLSYLDKNQKKTSHCFKLPMLACVDLLRGPPLSLSG